VAAVHPGSLPCSFRCSLHAFFPSLAGVFENQTSSIDDSSFSALGWFHSAYVCFVDSPFASWRAPPLFARRPPSPRNRANVAPCNRVLFNSSPLPASCPSHFFSAEHFLSHPFIPHRPPFSRPHMSERARIPIPLTFFTGVRR